tara:strand:- start:2428 stop:2655 length:228 start_codon:yes stop_codon:yes gene_type:complete
MVSLEKIFIENGKIINTIHLFLVGPYLAILGYLLNKNITDYETNKDILSKAVISLIIVGSFVICYHSYLLLLKNK